MATRDPAITRPGPSFSLQVATWSGLLNGDVGNAFEFTDWADRTVQVSGTFGAGGNVLIEGSNDGTNWNTLTDATGAALGTITTATLKQLTEAPRFARPRVSAGDGTTNLTVVLLARRNFKL